MDARPALTGGLGLRRVEWQTHADNAASRRAALRIGFEFEGIVRWQRVFPRCEVALPVEALEKRNGTKGELPGRHTTVFSIVWDEWDDKRPNVVALMERKR
jgi:RimJ/RimL family protein N-acetyltransferase